MRRALKRALWLVPVGVAFVDLGASVLQVQGGSMRPTLNPALHGPCDWVLVDKASIKLLRRYTRGEVVVLRCDYVIALPSSLVVLLAQAVTIMGCQALRVTGAATPTCLPLCPALLCSAHGICTAHCSAPEDPHQQIVKRLLALQGDTLLEDAGRSSAHVEVPRGRCWIEGDNPDLSTDSRSAYGPVRRARMHACMEACPRAQPAGIVCPPMRRCMLSWLLLLMTTKRNINLGRYTWAY